MPVIYATGENILDSAQVQTTTGSGNEGEGTITVNNGTLLFQPDDFVVFDVQNTTGDGELDGGSGVIGAVVYDNFADFLNGVPKYTYTPINPGQEANIQDSLSGLGDSYVRFNANVLTSSDPGAPAFNELLITPNVDWTVTPPTSGHTIDRFTDHDFNDSGAIDAGTTEDSNGLFSGTDWNAEVLAAADTRDFVVEGTSANDTIEAGYIGDPDGDTIDGNDAADGSNDDVIHAGAGDDVVRAGYGDDIVFGGAGIDVIGGGRGSDTLSGGDEGDFLFGDAQGIQLGPLASTSAGPATDLTVINSADGPIELWFIDATATPVFFATIGPGQMVVQPTFEEHNWALLDENGFFLEVIEGAPNQTVNYGTESLDDVIDGDAGDDSIFGNFGDDTLTGGDGADTILGGSGDDIIDGGTGDDSIDAGQGNDTVTGGTGSDTLIVSEAPTGVTHSVFDGGEDGPDDGTADGDADVLDLSALTPGVDYTISYAPVGGDVQGSSNGSQTSEDGVVNFADGSTLTFSNVEFVVCFTRGTQIETDRGAVAVEELTQGDRVLTQDRGYQPIRWIGWTAKSSEELASLPNLFPIRIKQGALGPAIPAQDLLVSPQHRILVRSKIAYRMFGEDEVLVAAKHLVGTAGIEVATDVMQVEYFHILFDQHEIVTSNGALSESLFTGPQALKALSADARNEIFALFPELMHVNYEALACRPLPNGRKARQLAFRHQKNETDLVPSASKTATCGLHVSVSC